MQILKDPEELLRRLTLALATAAMVTFTAYLCAWAEYGNDDYLSWEQFRTRRTLRQLQDDIERHQERMGELPRSLADLRSVEDSGMPTDGWNRPLQYRLKRDSATSCSPLAVMDNPAAGESMPTFTPANPTAGTSTRRCGSSPGTSTAGESR